MTSIHRFVTDSELLSGLDDTTREQIIAELQPVPLRGGQLLFHQGEIGDCLYIVGCGRLRVSRERDDGTAEVIGEIARGETVGEMALLTNEPRSATVRAARDCELYKLSAAAFNRLLEQAPRVTMQLARQIVTRHMRSLSGRAPAPVSSSIALVPTRRETPLSAVARRLERALAAIGPVVRLNSDVVDAALGRDAAQRPPDHARAGEVLSWLYEQETAHRFVIYEADLVPSAWSQRCARHGDRLLLVANGDEPPQAGPPEGSTRHPSGNFGGVRKELLLLHRQARPIYQGTDAWLTGRDVSAVHHVALDRDADIERVARFVTGRATGVVLGGGGARSFAHIGVLRAIEEAGIPIDAIGGASMGAYIAAQYALGWDTERMRAYNRDTWARVKPMQDYTLPMLSVLTGRGFRTIARDICGDTAIEDLGRRFFCVSTDLTHAALNVHQHHGVLWRAILASISVPGLLPPVCESGRLLVDGAILDNVPIDAMRRVCEGTVIASDVGPAEELGLDAGVSLPASGWRSLLSPRRALPGRRKPPTIVDVLLRVSTVSSAITVQSMAGKAQLYLRPPTKEFTVVDWKRVDAMIDRAYEYAAPVIADWGTRQAGPGADSEGRTRWRESAPTAASPDRDEAVAAWRRRAT